MATRTFKRNERTPSPDTLVSRTALRVLAGITDAELTLWEREEFIVPVNRTDSIGEPLYDASVLRRARLIRTLAEELDVNLPGIEVILHLLDQIAR
jgi:DNA-binding transcriptional MerR regulator